MWVDGDRSIAVKIASRKIRTQKSGVVVLLVHQDKYQDFHIAYHDVQCVIA